MRETKVILDGASPLSVDDFIVVPPDRGLLVCRARVIVDGAFERYLLVMASPDDAHDVTLESLAPVLAGEVPETKIVLVLDSQDGWAVGAIEPKDEGAARQVAASVAVMRASWGWDESPVIAVLVNDVGYEVSTRYDGEYWSALTCD